MRALPAKVGRPAPAARDLELDPAENVWRRLRDLEEPWRSITFGLRHSAHEY